MFITDFPFEQGHTVFDCYFNMEFSAWYKFDMLKASSRVPINYAEQPQSLRMIQNIYVPTIESVKA